MTVFLGLEKGRDRYVYVQQRIFGEFYVMCLT